MRHTVLSTVHGSHLYGLAHANSDLDTYEVVVGGDKNFARQSNRETDALRLHLSRFQRSVRDGVPQALEALFSPVAEYDGDYAPFLRGATPRPDCDTHDVPQDHRELRPPLRWAQRFSS